MAMTIIKIIKVLFSLEFCISGIISLYKICAYQRKLTPGVMRVMSFEVYRANRLPQGLTPNWPSSVSAASQPG